MKTNQKRPTNAARVLKNSATNPSILLFVSWVILNISFPPG